MRADQSLSSDLGQRMQPAGYMAKFVAQRPDWLDCAGVAEVFSVSRCISGDFCDYTDFWMYNRQDTT